MLYNTNIIIIIITIIKIKAFTVMFIDYIFILWMLYKIGHDINKFIIFIMTLKSF